MKYLSEFVIIMGITLVAEILAYLIPLLIPSSIYGIVLFIGLLYFNIIDVKDVENVGLFLVSILSIILVPSAINLINNFDMIKELFIVIIIVCSIGTFIVMITTGLVSQFIINRFKK